MSNNKLKLTFCGGTGEVTGANFLVEANNSKFLVDCGMFQGSEFSGDKNKDSFPYNPSEIDALLITHAHQDHIGRVPKLVKDGFKGTIYSTEATKELSGVMLEDTVGILEYHAKESGTLPLYEQKDVDKAMSLWKGIPYHNNTEFLPGLRATFFDAGHVLGSSMVLIEHESKRILFTGDLGNSPSPLLHNIEEVKDIDYVVMESVYGDREHEDKDERTKQLETAIEDVIERKGVLMIPAFSLERTQELLFEINNFVEHKRIPKVDIYLDSPLAIKVTEIYKNNQESFNKETRKIIKSGDDIFAFPGLTMTERVEESKAINHSKNPKIIIAGSGMMTGGRIMHHAKHYLSDSKNMLLFVGYQAAGTTGRMIVDGAKEVTIYKDTIPVKAEVRSVSGYSGHAGSSELVGFIEGLKPSIKKVFCVMGETKSALFLVQRLRDYLGVNAVSPEAGESVEL